MKAAPKGPLHSEWLTGFYVQQDSNLRNLDTILAKIAVSGYSIFQMNSLEITSVLDRQLLLQMATA